MRKRQFIRHLLAERDQLELIFNQLGFSKRMTMPGVSGAWSVKDLIAHFLVAEQFLADRLQAAAQGELPSPSKTQAELEAFLAHFGYPDFDSPCLEPSFAEAWSVEKYRSIPLEEVVAQEVNAFNAVVAALENLSLEQLTQNNLFPRIVELTSEHYRTHRVEIERWLAEQKRVSNQ